MLGPPWTPAPVALVKVTQPGVAQPHSLTDPLLSLFDNNPNMQAIVLQLHDTDARAVAEHFKNSCGGPNRGMSFYLRKWGMPNGSPGIQVSGDLAACWRKWECKAQQVQRGHWEDTAPLYSLHSQSAWSWHADLEGHTLPTWYKGTGMHPSLFFPLTTTPLFGVEHHRVTIPLEVVDHRHIDDIKDLPQWGHAFQTGISIDWMERLEDEYGELRGDAGVNIFNQDDGQALASWWVFDGGDDTARLQRMDVLGKLNDQVKTLEAEGGIEIGGTPKKLLCFKSGHGKVMLSGSCGKCWNCNLKYDQFQAHSFAIAACPVLARIGSLMSCIPPVRNVGDVAHCCAREGIGIGKRLKDSARTWGSPGALKAVSHFISNLQQEVKHILVAGRVMRAPSKEKEHTLDINASCLFF